MSLKDCNQHKRRDTQMRVAHDAIISTAKYEGGLKSSYDDIISVVDDFFDQWDPSTATQIEEICGRQRGLC